MPRRVKETREERGGSDRAVTRSMGSVDLNNPEGITLQVRRYEQMKEEKRMATIKDREMDELKDCTFKPKTNMGKRGGKGEGREARGEWREGRRRRMGRG